MLSCQSNSMIFQIGCEYNRFLRWNMVPGSMSGFMGKEEIVEGIAGMGIAFLFFFLILCVAPGSFGGGDVKLSVANGCYLGLECWIESFVIAVFSAAFWILYQRIYKKKGEEKEIAFGPFLCLGAFLAKIV